MLVKKVFQVADEDAPFRAEVASAVDARMVGGDEFDWVELVPQRIHRQVFATRHEGHVVCNGACIVEGVGRR